MIKSILPILSLLFLVGCADSSNESTTENKSTNTDTTDTEQNIDTLQEESIAHIVPKDLEELDTLMINPELLTEYSGPGIFYSDKDSIAFKDYESGATKYISTSDINGKTIDVVETYKYQSSDDYYNCCDSWTGEEFCTFYLRINTPKLNGYVNGEYIFEMPEYSPGKADLIDTLEDVTYSFYTAENFKGCYRQLLLLENGDEQFHILPLFEGEFDAGVLQLYGEWTNIRSTFFRNNHPVVLVTDGVDGNYTYTFYEILKQGDQYIANRYYETYVMVTLDEFDNGFDFDSVLHEEYKIANDGEDFPYN